MSVTSVAVQFTIIDQLSKGINRIRSRMAELARGNKEVQNSFDRMNRSAKYAAIAAIGTREIYRGLKPAVSAAGDLQAEMLATRAELMGSVKNARILENQLKRIKSTAFEVQAWTPFDQGQIVALEKQLLKSGAKANAVTGKAGAAAAAAALGTYEGLDPVDMGKKLIGIATPFKMHANQFMDLADSISRAASASTVGAAEIAETAKYAAPAMSKLGRSTHEMLVMSAMLAQSGIDASMAGTGLRQFFNAAAKQKAFQDAAGNLKPMAEIVEIIRRRVAGMGDAEQLTFLTKIFDVRGAPVAIALMNKGAASFEQIEKTMHNSLPLSEKLAIKMQGLNTQLTSLRGTSRSTLANLFQPALSPLIALISRTNQFIAMIGQATQGSDALANAVSGMSLGALATGGLATAGLTTAAGFHLRKVWKGVGGLKGIFSGMGSAAAGIATGKAVEAATGVQPVFVTNWPANFGSGAGAMLKDTDKPGLFTRLADGVKKSWGWLAGLGVAGYSTAAATLSAPSLAAIASLGAGATAVAGALTALAGAAGYGTGRLMDMGASAVITRATGGENTNLGELIYDLNHRQKAEKLERFAERSEHFRETIYSGGSQPEVRNDIALDVRIDRDDRVFTETNDMRSQARVNVNRGRF